MELSREELDVAARLDELSPSPPRPMYFDRQGNPISFGAWAMLTERRLRGDDYHRVDETHLPDGRWISTVWLGMDYGWGQGPPVIFETMVFDRDDDVDMDRCSTESWARWTHRYMVGYYRARPSWRGILHQFVLAWRDATSRRPS